MLKIKEYSDLNEIINDAKSYISFGDDQKDLEKIIADKESDDEIKLMAEQELADLKLNYNKMKKKIFLYQSQG